MCSGPEQLKPEPPASISPKSATKNMDDPPETIKSEVSVSTLLECAAADDVQGFKVLLVHTVPSVVNEVGIWYGRERGSKKMMFQQRTPLMIAATYGSLDIVKLIVSFSEANINLSCGTDKTTALHCAASSGCANAFDIVKLLVLEGANVDSLDANGLRPIDVVFAPPNLPSLWFLLEQHLGNNDCVDQVEERIQDLSTGMKDKKEYPVDPSLPDIKSGVFSTDEFRMFSFKVRPCSRAYSHDWTECPFIHPGENARRRDPRKFHYSCVPCPEFRKGQCRRGDLCEYAHGVFECWLHPAQYKTRLCKDGVACARRVCFFAHTSEELRPLYMSTASPTAVSAMSPSSFTPPISPSAMSWSQPNVPTLHLPNSIQASRLRTSFNARDIPLEELSMLLDYELQQQQLFNDMPNLSMRSQPLAPLNLDELLSAEVSSPRFSDPANFSPSRKPLVLNQLHANLFSPKGVSSYGVSSPGIMSPRAIEPQPSTPISSRLKPALLHHEQLHSLGANLPHEPSPNGSGFFGSFSNWESINGKVDWSVNGDELAKARRSLSNGHGVTEPDLSWVQSLMKESMPGSESNTVSKQ